MNHECIICLEPLNNNIAILSCNHKYHYHCIQQWISKKNSLTKICTICEHNVEIINITQSSNAETQTETQNAEPHIPFKQHELEPEPEPEIFPNIFKSSELNVSCDTFSFGFFDIFFDDTDKSTS